MFNAGTLGVVTVSSGSVNINAVTLYVPVSDIRSVHNDTSIIRIVGLNDETLQFIPAQGSYLTVSI